MYNVEWFDIEEHDFVDQNFSTLEDALDCAHRHGTCAVDEDGNEYW